MQIVSWVHILIVLIFDIIFLPVISIFIIKIKKIEIKNLELVSLKYSLIWRSKEKKLNTSLEKMNLFIIPFGILLLNCCLLSVLTIWIQEFEFWINFIFSICVYSIALIVYIYLIIRYWKNIMPINQENAENLYNDIFVNPTKIIDDIEFSFKNKNHSKKFDIALKKQIQSIKDKENITKVFWYISTLIRIFRIFNFRGVKIIKNNTVIEVKKDKFLIINQWLMNYWQKNM